MNDRIIDDITALLPPLLHALDGLAFVARYFHPPEIEALIQALGAPDAPLRELRARLDTWPDGFSDLRTELSAATDTVIAAHAGLRHALEAGDLRGILRALRLATQAQETLYPFCARLPPVGEFFLDPSVTADDPVRAKLTAPPLPGTGVFHEANESAQRGGYSVYVPEYPPPPAGWPLVMALHGGSGHGRAFLWTWLRDARSFGAIIVAPTAIGPTWALSGNDVDSPNLSRILASVRARWTVNGSQLLLTGLSDGGTFCYVSGLDPASPFTHLAPVAASFHPMLASMADAERMSGLPVCLVHGQHDWMFPVEIARNARDTLTERGADVTYRELDNLSHTWPREENLAMLQWLRETTKG